MPDNKGENKDKHSKNLIQTSFSGEEWLRERTLVQRLAFLCLFYFICLFLLRLMLCKCVGVTTVPPSCAECHEIWEP